ncbi:uncharacterized protein LOC112085048 isoform X2 [Eutrema salsugineum]|uniref:uncharacterized protein LOC112085048 isoform X2 n=1 Tax=Eutrema salsugineum TaxID=72664 RepID=UPI000CED5C3C|nr:uncharacterized protein LOC112085048 isoform X2 [Eutrema salsugineum]
MTSSGRNSDRRRPRPSESTPPVQQRMPPRTSASDPVMPPGAIGSTSAASSVANNYTRMTLDALLNSPSREFQPHLHPRKLNGALWFGIDPSVYKFIKTTWQAYYMGPWSSWKFVPEERTDKWWQTFVQNYYWESRFHDLVYKKWKVHTQQTICQKISKRKRQNQKPKFINDVDWTTLKEQWATEPALKRSKSAAGSRISDPTGKGMHKHCAGPAHFGKIEYDMMIESGSAEPPPYTAFVRKTHTRKDGTFIDARAESIVLEVEEAVTQMTTDDGSPNASTAATSRIKFNQEYLKRGLTTRGRIYGIGSVQDRDITPSEPVPASLKRNLDTEIRISGLETHHEAVNNNVQEL